MPSYRRKHLNQWVPIGLVVTKRWLLARGGFSRHTLDNLVKSGTLEVLHPGVYQRPETHLRWEGVATSLQRMALNLVVGGLTALELQGHVQYLSMGGRHVVHLYGKSLLPNWTNKLGLSQTFVRHSTVRLFGSMESDHDSTATSSKRFTRELPWGDHSWSLEASTPERGLLELLDAVPKQVSFEHADQLMEGLTTLSPNRLQSLLHRTRSIKVKRLFFWFAERYGHAWARHLDSQNYDLGSGKRSLVPGGKLVAKYQITVPEEFDG